MSTIISTKTSGVGGLSVTGDASGILQLASADGTTALTIDASQNVGIGTSSPTAKLDILGINGNIQVNANGDQIAFTRNGYNYLTATGANATMQVQASGASGVITLATNSLERMRIDSSGNLLVGTTSAILTTARLTVATTVSAGIVSATNSNTNLFCVNTNNTSWNAISFRYNTSTEVGHIDCTSTATTYTSGSDYRLKESITPMVGGLDKIMLLNPVDFIWRINNSKGQGFIAHELQEHFPDAVSGEKDAFETYTDEDGTEQSRPKYQGVDPSKIVGALTAAIQELKAIIDTQNARIEALEAKI